LSCGIRDGESVWVHDVALLLLLGFGTAPVRERFNAACEEVAGEARLGDDCTNVKVNENAVKFEYST
jgi:hypothetical protein